MNPKLFTIHQVEKDDIELYSMNEWLRALKRQQEISTGAGLTDNISRSSQVHCGFKR